MLPEAHKNNNEAVKKFSGKCLLEFRLKNYEKQFRWQSESTET